MQNIHDTWFSFSHFIVSENFYTFFIAEDVKDNNVGGLMRSKGVDNYKVGFT